jgi:pimeloyl-ACP methyl ester carboxylesterase
MLRSFFFLPILLCFAGSARAESIQTVQLQTADDLIVYGDLYRLDEGARGTLLLFHQAGANARAEYGPLIPRLLEAGYEILAIDQRAGGKRLGGANRTVKALKPEKEPGYCEAYPDLEAALDYALDLEDHGPIVVWGSSYSAGLVIRLAADHGDDLAGVLAFSPAAGEPMTGCDPSTFAPGVRIPVLALRPAREASIPHVEQQMKTFAQLGFETYVADPGVHGSSMLNAERVGGDVSSTWDVVLAFLDRIVTEKTE